jgi:citronellol/citronellal dehydrogenase
MNKYDLINSINARGTFAMTRAVLPHMMERKFGRIIMMSPPISNDVAAYAGRTAYNLSKYGMTMVALGVAAEYKGTGITANALWPATIIESQASKNFQLGERKMWRKALILAEATAFLCKQANNNLTGNAFIDDEYLRKYEGFQDHEFIKYRCDSSFEPPRLLANENSGFHVTRGNAKTVAKDALKSRM